MHSIRISSPSVRRVTHNLLALSAIAGIAATTSGCLPEYHLRINVGQPDSGFSLDKPSMAATNDIDELRDIVDQFGTINVLVTSSVDAEGRLAWRDVILRDVLSSGTSYTRRTYDHLSVLSLEVDREALDRLAASDDVESVTLNVPSPLNTLPHANVVGANRTQKFGLGGAGQTIVIADSGVDASHPLLSGHVIDGACFSTDSASSTSLCPNGASEAYGIDAGGACEDTIAGCDHGTHVAGIGRTIAPESTLISVQVFSEFDAECATYGLASPCVLTWQDDLLAALDYVVDLSQTDPSIASLNMSLGGGVFSGACDDDPRAEAIKMLRDLGVTTVVAAGNDGSADGVSAPGCISAALTVGATSFTDEVSSFSNGGPLVDLLAPGESILSTVPGGIDRMSGTSMAAPHVAASIAVLRSVSPDLTVDEIETLLKATGQPVTDSRSGLVHPRLQLDASAYRVYTAN